MPILLWSNEVEHPLKKRAKTLQNRDSLNFIFSSSWKTLI